MGRVRVTLGMLLLVGLILPSAAMSVSTPFRPAPELSVLRARAVVTVELKEAKALRVALGADFVVWQGVSLLEGKQSSR